MKRTLISGVARPVILVAAASFAAAACTATAAEMAGRGFGDSSYDAAERARAQFAVAVGGSRSPGSDTSIDEAERIKAAFRIPAAGPDTSYDAVESVRAGR